MSAYALIAAVSSGVGFLRAERADLDAAFALAASALKVARLGSSYAPPCKAC